MEYPRGCRFDRRSEAAATQLPVVTADFLAGCSASLDPAAAGEPPLLGDVGSRPRRQRRYVRGMTRWNAAARDVHGADRRGDSSMTTIFRPLDLPGRGQGTSVRRVAPLLLLLNLLAPARVEATPAGYCWRSLVPPTGDQDEVLEPLSFRAAGADDLWLSWDEGYSPRIFRWTKGEWARIPAIPENARRPGITVSPRNVAFLDVAANGDDGTTSIHVSRWNGGGWAPFGSPVLSTGEPFTHVSGFSLAFTRDETPIIAWSEERHVRLAGLFFARWTGASWKSLRAPRVGGDSYSLDPRLFVDAQDRVWLTWHEESRGRARLRVARLNGTAWAEVGRASLQRLSSDSLSSASLAVDSAGRAWLAWIKTPTRGESQLALARLDGKTWVAVAPPAGAGLPSAEVWSAAMLLGSGGPIVAWSQADASENHTLFVAERVGTEWAPRLSAFHLVEGVSNVGDVHLAPAGPDAFFVAWNEPGNDGRTIRVIEARACRPGEVPAVVPKSVIERETWPATVDEAATRLVATLDEESKGRVRETKREDLIQFHHGWGTGIRNGFGLWRGNSRLLASCGAGKPVHPDDCSMLIIEAVHERLQTPPDAGASP